MKIEIFEVTEQHEEPCEGRLSRTVLWEGRGETPLLDPIMPHEGRNDQPSKRKSPCTSKFSSDE